MPTELATGAGEKLNACQRPTEVRAGEPAKVETWIVKPSYQVEEAEFRNHWGELNWGPPPVEFTFLPGGVMQAHVHCAQSVKWDPVELIKALEGTLRKCRAKA